MTFRYINPGYAELFDSYSVGNAASRTFNPVNGVSINGKGEARFNLPEGCGEVWVKFGFYFDSTSWQLSCMIGSTQNTYGFLRNKYEDNRAYFGGTQTRLPNNADYAFHTVWMHCRAGESGLLEIYVDGTEAFSREGQIDWQEPCVYFWLGFARVYASNIIISDREIAKTDEVYVLVPSGTETDMENDGGLYTAESEGQYVRQTIDVAALKALAGSAAVSVTGLAVAAIPAYYEGEGLTSLVATRNGADVEAVALSTNAGAGIISSWDEAMPADALADVKLGWRTAR